MAGVVARYDGIAEFFEQRSGKSVTDPGTAALLELAGDVSGLRILEVACGQGRVARELARRGASVTGLDISAELLAKARAYQEAEPLGIHYLYADVTASGLLEGQVFDTVVCNFGLTGHRRPGWPAGQCRAAAAPGRSVRVLAAASVLSRLGQRRAQ